MIPLPPMPPSIARLPLDERGYPVPWFVAWVDGKPEFRAASGEKLVIAIRDRRCWVCGGKILLVNKRAQLAFVIGPMCVVNRNTAEPPCHLECAEFSAKACPFLTKPKAVRRDANMPDEVCGFENLPGIAIPRNPGATCIYVCDEYEVVRDKGGYLFSLPAPTFVKWYAEGREATREEVLASINSGLPILQKYANEDGAAAELDRYVNRAMELIPAA